MSAAQPDARYLPAHSPELADPVSPPESSWQYSPRRASHYRALSLSDDDEDDDDVRFRKNGQDIANPFYHRRQASSPREGLGITAVHAAQQQQQQQHRDTASNPPPPSFTDATSTPSSNNIYVYANANAGRSKDAARFDERPYNPPDYVADDPSRGYVSPAASSINTSYHGAYTTIENVERGATPSGRSQRSGYDGRFDPPKGCPSHRHFHQGRCNWLSISILALSVYSTIFSGIFFLLAAKGPRYGGRIRSHGALSPGGAIILTSVLAKTIELSFVTAFVAFLGQTLSRRIFEKERKGVTLAEMGMRNWIMQPGTLITHWHAVRYAGITFLGALALLATVMSTLYTAAASALVQPQLRFGEYTGKLMMGSVKTSFANPTYLANQCATPIKGDIDPVGGQNVGGTTCLQITHAAQGYHNYAEYLKSWSEIANLGDGTTDLVNRPQGQALLNENITITGQWVEIVDPLELSSKYDGRVIHNISLAMPHAGVAAAAEDKRNGIMQPNDLDGQGIYSLRASVPSPVMHVTCANLNAEEMEPLVYASWPNANLSLLETSWPAVAETPQNKTVVDDVFGWGDDWMGDDATQQPRPAFARLPIQYNTVLNHSLLYYGKYHLYVLGADAKGETYSLCALKASLTPFCSTRFNVSGHGGTMEAICAGNATEDNSDDSMRYINSLRNASSGSATISKDWINVASEWGNSLSLNAGFFSGNASNARLLTQLIRSQPGFSRVLPSAAEVLAVMASSTLLMSTVDSPFVPFWNYSSDVGYIDSPQTQYFNASLRSQEYGSGGANNSPNRGFFVVLFSIFLLNVWVLGYFLVHHGLVTDFSEPPNMFAIAVNSPPSVHLAGSCGGGPEKEQYSVPWFVYAENEHLYMEAGDKSRSGGGRESALGVLTGKTRPVGFFNRFRRDRGVAVPVGVGVVGDVGDGGGGGRGGSSRFWKRNKKTNNSITTIVTPPLPSTNTVSPVSAAAAGSSSTSHLGIELMHSPNPSISSKYQKLSGRRSFH